MAKCKVLTHPCDILLDISDSEKGYEMTKMNYNTGELIGSPYDDRPDEIRTGTVWTWCFVCENDFQEKVNGIVSDWDEDGAIIEWEDGSCEACPTCGQWWSELQRDDWNED